MPNSSKAAKPQSSKDESSIPSADLNASVRLPRPLVAACQAYATLHGLTFRQLVIDGLTWRIGSGHKTKGKV